MYIYLCVDYDIIIFYNYQLLCFSFTLLLFVVINLGTKPSMKKSERKSEDFKTDLGGKMIIHDDDDDEMMESSEDGKKEMGKTEERERER